MYKMQYYFSLICFIYLCLFIVKAAGDEIINAKAYNTLKMVEKKGGRKKEELVFPETDLLRDKKSIGLCFSGG